MTVIKRIVEYFGYTFDTSFFDNNFLRNVYVCSAVSSNRVAAALPHWTVSEFFDELEKFLCAVTVVNERTKVVSLVGLNDYFTESGKEIIPASSLLREFTVDIEDEKNEKDLSMPGSPEHTANASLYFEKGGLNLRLSYNFASDFIDEMGESTFYDRYYDKMNYMDVNASYTFGKKFKTTFYAEANNLLNQPLRYYQGTKDRTMQAEYYGVKVNAGVKINF